MCLDTVDSKPNKDVKWGYKTFYRWGGCIVGQVFTSDKYTRGYPIGEWIEDDYDGYIPSNSSGYYRSGFHFCEDIPQLDTNPSLKNCYLVFKVEVDDVVASGYQCYDRVHVARKMKIIEEVKYDKL